MKGFLHDEANGLYRIPPFRDAHMHFMVDGRAASPRDSSKIAESCIKHGILSVMDMGHRTGAGIGAKADLEGKVAVKTAGFAVCKAGGYGEFLGRSVRGVKDIEKTVREISEAGADFIKVINSGVVGPGDKVSVTAGGFSLEELKIIQSEARARNLPMVCHANSDPAIKDAVVAGAVSIEHGFFVSEETLHMMAESKVSWTPTVSALSAQKAHLAGSEISYVEKVIDDHIFSISLGSSLGITLRIGTDAGSRGIAHGESFFEEISFFMKAGLSEGQIIDAACLPESENDRGAYLIIREDFFKTGEIGGVYRY